MDTDKSSKFSIKAFNTGNERALQSLFETYYQPLCYFAQQLTSHRGASEEIAVDSFLKAWERRSQFDNLAALKSFLYIAAKNASLDHIKKESRRHSREQQWDNANSVPLIRDNEVLNQIIKTEVLSEIRQAISGLPDHYSQVLDMAFNQGLKSKEIAEQLGVPISTVDNRKARGLALLKKMLSSRSFLILLLLLHGNQS